MVCSAPAADWSVLQLKQAIEEACNIQFSKFSEEVHVGLLWRRVCLVAPQQRVVRLGVAMEETCGNLAGFKIEGMVLGLELLGAQLPWSRVGFPLVIQ